MFVVFFLGGWRGEVLEIPRVGLRMEESCSVTVTKGSRIPRFERKPSEAASDPWAPLQQSAFHSLPCWSSRHPDQKVYGWNPLESHETGSMCSMRSTQACEKQRIIASIRA